MVKDVIEIKRIVANLPKRDSSTQDGLLTTDFLDYFDRWDLLDISDLGYKIKGQTEFAEIISYHL